MLNSRNAKMASHNEANVKPRIAIVVDQRFLVDKDGAYYTRANLRRELLDGYARYFDVTVFARVRKLRDSEPKPGDAIRNPSVRFIALPTWEARSFILEMPRIFLRIFRNLRGFDVAVLRMVYFSSILAFPICLLRRIPFIIQLVGDPEGISELQTKLGTGWASQIVVRIARGAGKTLLSMMKRRAAYCTAVSSILAQRYFGTEVSVSDTRLETLPVEIQNRSRSRDTFLVLFVGRLVHMKNPDKLLEAISLVADRIPGISAVFVGDGPLRKSLEEQAHAPNLQGKVDFAGFVAEPAKLFQFYSEADVLVLPSSSGEGLPLVIIEAMAHGTPVVATDVGGIREVVLHGRTGYLLSKPEPIEIAHYLEVLASNRELHYQFATAARELAQGYTVDVQVKKMRQIVDGILAERSGRR